MKSNDASKTKNASSNVIHLFKRKPWQAICDEQVVRLAPELDGLEMLYSNDTDTSRMFNMKILCWGLNKKGAVNAMVPWLGKLQDCRSLTDPLNGHWKGYFDSTRNDIFFEAPIHKVKELIASSHYFSGTCDKDNIIQEIPDNIGTHAVFSEDKFKSILLRQVISWCLLASGQVHAMVADPDKATKTPVLLGDSCLHFAEEQKGFKYFFHHAIANKIKEGDKDILSAFSGLLKL